MRKPSPETVIVVVWLAILTYYIVMFSIQK